MAKSNRLLLILESLVKNSKVSVKELALRCETTPRTIQKPIEAEKILLDIRDELDNGERYDEVNKRLLEIYKTLINSKNSHISPYELRFKLEQLRILFNNI